MAKQIKAYKNFINSKTGVLKLQNTESFSLYGFNWIHEKKDYGLYVLDSTGKLAALVAFNDHAKELLEKHFNPDKIKAYFSDTASRLSGEALADKRTFFENLLA